ncbi:MAG: DUF3857 domain-containing protein [Deltaproteobacteria bacterium]|nr:DUF3857 domain-containing protein [Deltaproteobacteria bacterium]
MFRRWIMVLFVAGVAVAACPNSVKSGTSTPERQSCRKFGYDVVFLEKSKETVIGKGGGVRTRVHVLKKILTYKGKKEHAHCKLHFNREYETLRVVFARTIKPDNTTIEVKGEWIHEIMAPRTASAALYSKYREVTVEFPGVEVGDRVEIEYEIVRRPVGVVWGRTIFQGTDPVRNARFELITPANFVLSTFGKVGTGFKQEVLHDGRTRRAWWGSMIEGLPEEGHQPSPENLYPTLFYSSATGWEDVGRWFISRLLPDLKEDELKGLLSSAPPWDTPDELYSRLVKRLSIVDIDLDKSRYEVTSPSVVLKRNYADNKDASVLFFELLRARGFSPQLVLYNGGEIFLDGLKDVPSPGLFNQVMVKVGRSYYEFSSRSRYYDPGYTGRMGRWGLLLPACRWEKIRSRSMSGKDSRIVLHLENPGEIHGRVTEVHHGLYGVELREALTGMGRERKRIFWDRWMNDLDPLAGATSGPEVLHLLQSGVPPEIRATYRVPRGIPGIGANLFSPLPLEDRFMKYLVVGDRRLGPFAVFSTLTGRLDLEIRYPAAWRVKYLPPEVKKDTPCFSSTLRVECPLPGVLKVLREIKIKRGLIQGEKAYQVFCRAVRESLGLRARLVCFQKP